MEIKQIETRFRETSDSKCSFAENGMIATQSLQASKAGSHILQKGGNAVDAAVAAAFVLSVTEPQASGLGGQTMMLLRIDGKVMAIDGSSRAPSLAHSSSIYEHDKSLGYRATTVPSTLATLWYVHKQYGSLDWAQILDPAIHYAENGFPVTPLQHSLLKREQEKFNQVGSKSGLSYFYKDGIPYKEGEIFKQKDLAHLLKTLVKTGIESFYRGSIAKQIDADMRENGGLLRYDDLALVPFPIEREPLVRSFRDVEIYTMPPPGSGRTLLFTLMMLDWVPKEILYKDDVTRYYLFAQLMRKSLLERSDRPFDPNFFPQIADNADMLDPLFARECVMDIIKDYDKTILPFIPTLDELHGDTTHLSVIDKAGNAVSLTQSIERVYGSKAAAQGLGFLYNNYLFDYEYSYPEHPYYLRPNGVPWATVSPSLLFHDEELWMSLGSPGSERIISTLALFLSRIIDENFSIDQAMKAPRLHCSLGGRVSLEGERISEDVIRFLKEKGFRIDMREDYSFYLGCIQAVMLLKNNKGFQGVADIRRDGAAIGF